MPLQNPILPLIISLCLLACSLKAQHNFYNPNPQTGNLIFYKPKQVSFAFLVMKEGRVNYQLGCSPMKHVSLSAAYMSQDRIQPESILNKKKKRAYSFSIGTYYFFGATSLNQDTTFVYNYDSKGSIIKMPISAINNNLWCNKGILLNLKAGYSKTTISDSFQSFTTTGSTSEVIYDGFYAQLGFAAKYFCGLFNMSYGLGQVNYKDVSFSGQFFSDYFILSTTSTLNRQSNYLASTINIQNQLGFRMGTFVIGGNVRLNDFLSTNHIDLEKGYFYGGILLELGEMVSLTRKRRK